MFQPVWQPVLMFGSPSIYIHSAERSVLAPDHPDKFSMTRKALFQLGLLEQPENRISVIRQDYLEDTLYTTVGAYLAASISCVVRLGGHVPFTPSLTGRNVWTMPTWASKLLFQARMARYFAAYWAVGMTYVTSYNLLTGFLGFPVNELHNCQPQASVVSVMPAVFVFALLSPNRRPERPWTGRATPFIGRLFLGSILGVAVAVFHAQRFAQTSPTATHRPTGKDSYFETLRERAPSADLVADMPYIPFYKESPTIPFLPLRNPHYDPEYVAKARAEVRQKLDHLY